MWLQTWLMVWFLWFCNQNITEQYHAKLNYFFDAFAHILILRICKASFVLGITYWSTFPKRTCMRTFWDSLSVSGVTQSSAFLLNPWMWLESIPSYIFQHILSYRLESIILHTFNLWLHDSCQPQTVSKLGLDAFHREDLKQRWPQKETKK